MPAKLYYYSIAFIALQEELCQKKSAPSVLDGAEQECFWRSANETHAEAVFHGIIGGYLIQPSLVFLGLNVGRADGAPVGGVLMTHEVEEIIGVVLLIHKGLIIALLAVVREQPLGDFVVVGVLGNILPQTAGVSGGVEGIVVGQLAEFLGALIGCLKLLDDGVELLICLLYTSRCV